MPEPARGLFLDGGRALQRIWLAADAAGLAMHPLASVPVFFSHVQVLKGRRLPAEHIDPVRRQIATFDSLVPRAAGRVLFILFRLGNAPRPQMHSVRRSAEDVFVGPE